MNKWRVPMRNAGANSNTAPKFFNVVKREEGSNEATINLYGDIISFKPENWLWDNFDGSYEFICPDYFMNDLKECEGCDKITVHINSGGGDLYTGIAIYSQLKALNAEITVVVDGLAASAASIIACAGDKVIGSAGSLFMVHEPTGGLNGYYNVAELKNVIKGLNAGIDAIAEIYAEKTGRTVDEMKSMINKTSWMTGKQALENGFYDELLVQEANSGMQNNISISKDRKTLVSNGIEFSMAAAVDEKIAKALKPIATEPVAPKSINKNNQGGKRTMTREELMAQDPELYNSIKSEGSQEVLANVENQVADAVTAERNRIQAIDSIAGVCDPALVQEAKFGENACSAQELAFRNMQEQATKGTQVVQNLSTEGQMNSVVTATPVGADASATAQEKDDVIAAQMIAGIKPTKKED